MVKETGSHICQRTVGEHSLSGYGPIAYMNRPVRTRMPGGVGAKTPGYPIRFAIKGSTVVYIALSSPFQLV
jgi:hypothetical protein